MDRETVIARLRAHEAELKAMGLESLSIFGSVARGEQGPDSDVDLAGRLDRARPVDAFDHVMISQRLNELLGVSVDFLSEPARKAAIATEIERDRVHVF